MAIINGETSTPSSSSGAYGRTRLSAEVARTDGRVLEAERLYEDAIRISRAHGSIRKEEFFRKHGSRVPVVVGAATLGDRQLSASIAHEINQPISAALINAHTGLRWLSADPPNLDGVREILGRIIRDANRTADVISRASNRIK